MHGLFIDAQLQEAAASAPVFCFLGLGQHKVCLTHETQISLIFLIKKGNLVLMVRPYLGKNHIAYVHKSTFDIIAGIMTTPTTPATPESTTGGVLKEYAYYKVGNHGIPRSTSGALFIHSQISALVSTRTT